MCDLYAFINGTPAQAQEHVAVMKEHTQTDPGFCSHPVGSQSSFRSTQRCDALLSFLGYPW